MTDDAYLNQFFGVIIQHFAYFKAKCTENGSENACFGTGSRMDPDTKELADPHPESESRKAKTITAKN
jgi:hypothetical protein